MSNPQPDRAASSLSGAVCAPVLLVLSLVLSGCGQETEPARTVEPSATQPQEGSELVTDDAVPTSPDAEPQAQLQKVVRAQVGPAQPLQLVLDGEGQGEVSMTVWSPERTASLVVTAGGLVLEELLRRDHPLFGGLDLAYTVGGLHAGPATVEITATSVTEVLVQTAIEDAGPGPEARLERVDARTVEAIVEVPADQPRPSSITLTSPSLAGPVTMQADATGAVWTARLALEAGVAHTVGVQTAGERERFTVVAESAPSDDGAILEVPRPYLRRADADGSCVVVSPVRVRLPRDGEYFLASDFEIGGRPVAVAPHFTGRAGEQTVEVVVDQAALAAVTTPTQVFVVTPRDFDLYEQPGDGEAVHVATHPAHVGGSGASLVCPTGTGWPTAGFEVAASGLDVTFDATPSSDADGTIAAYAWDFGDGGTSTEWNPQHTYAAAGTYQVTFTVTDDGGAIGSVTRPVTVR